MHLNMSKRHPSPDIFARYHNRKEDNRLCLELAKLKLEQKSYLHHSFKERCSLQEFRTNVQTSTGYSVQNRASSSANLRLDFKNNEKDFLCPQKHKDYFSQWVIFSNDESPSRLQQEQAQLSQTRRDHLRRDWEARKSIRRYKSAPPTFSKHRNRSLKHSELQQKLIEQKELHKLMLPRETKWANGLSLDSSEIADKICKDNQFKVKRNNRKSNYNSGTHSQEKHDFIHKKSNYFVRPLSSATVSTHTSRVGLHPIADNGTGQFVLTIKEDSLRKRPKTTDIKRSSTHSYGTFALKNRAVISMVDIGEGDKLITGNRTCHENNREGQSEGFTADPRLSARLDTNQCETVEMVSSFGHVTRPVELGLGRPCCENVYNNCCFDGNISIPVHDNTGRSSKSRKITGYIKPWDRYKLDPVELDRRDRLLKKVHRSYIPFSVNKTRQQIAFPKAVRQRALGKLLTKNKDAKKTFTEDLCAKRVLESKVKKFIDKTKWFCMNGSLTKNVVS